MERHAIERLAMDATLGELNEDAAALFEAYLTEHPEARQWTEPMKGICQRTQKAVAAKTGSMALSPRHSATRTRSTVCVCLTSAGRWVAVVLVSLALGAIAGRGLMSRDGSPSRSARSTQTTHNSVQEDWQAVVGGRGQSFWEAKVAATLRRQHSPAGGSYEPRPSPWEMLKQHQKERRHAL